MEASTGGVFPAIQMLHAVWVSREKHSGQEANRQYFGHARIDTPIEQQRQCYSEGIGAVEASRGGHGLARRFPSTLPPTTLVEGGPWLEKLVRAEAHSWQIQIVK